MGKIKSYAKTRVGDDVTSLRDIHTLLSLYHDNGLIDDEEWNLQSHDTHTFVADSFAPAMLNFLEMISHQITCS